MTKNNTTIYGSDRDMFVFLADEENRIVVPNRRNGQSGSLAKGFFVWNSEVGSQSIGAAFFLFDYACSNRIVWGAQDFKEIRITPHRLGPVALDRGNQPCAHRVRQQFGGLGRARRSRRPSRSGSMTISMRSSRSGSTALR